MTSPTDTDPEARDRETGMSGALYKVLYDALPPSSPYRHRLERGINREISAAREEERETANEWRDAAMTAAPGGFACVRIGSGCGLECGEAFPSAPAKRCPQCLLNALIWAELDRTPPTTDPEDT